MLSAIVGLAFVSLGVWGLMHWWAEALIVMKGSLPALILLGGILAITAGATAIIDSLDNNSRKKDPNEEKK